MRLTDLTRQSPKQTLTEAETDPMVQRAIDYFGTTRDWREAGFVVPFRLVNSVLLDLSGKRDHNGYELVQRPVGDPVRWTVPEYRLKPNQGYDDLRGQRYADHTEIGIAVPEIDAGGDSRAHIIEFMRRTGSIRVAPGQGIGLTPQVSRWCLNRALKEMKAHNERIVVDLTTDDWTDHSREFSPRVGVEGVLKWIRGIASGRLTEKADSITLRYFNRPGAKLAVVRDPSLAELLGLISRSEFGQLRGLLLKDLFLIWPAEKADHNAVLMALNHDLGIDMKKGVNKLEFSLTDPELGYTPFVNVGESIKIGPMWVTENRAFLRTPLAKMLAKAPAFDQTVLGRLKPILPVNEKQEMWERFWWNPEQGFHRWSGTGNYLNSAVHHHDYFNQNPQIFGDHANDDELLAAVSKWVMGVYSEGAVSLRMDSSVDDDSLFRAAILACVKEFRPTKFFIDLDVNEFGRRPGYEINGAFTTAQALAYARSGKPPSNLTEARIEKMEFHREDKTSYREDLTIYVNPTGPELLQLLPKCNSNDMRGIVLNQNEFVMWDAYWGEHDVVIDYYEINQPDRFNRDQGGGTRLNLYRSIGVKPDLAILSWSGMVNERVKKLLKTPGIISEFDPKLRESLTEARIETNLGPMLVDPSLNQLVGLTKRAVDQQVRGFLTQNGGAVVWDADLAIHHKGAREAEKYDQKPIWHGYQLAQFMVYTWERFVEGVLGGEEKARALLARPDQFHSYKFGPVVITIYAKPMDLVNNPWWQQLMRRAEPARPVPGQTLDTEGMVEQFGEVEDDAPAQDAPMGIMAESEKGIYAYYDVVSDQLSLMLEAFRSGRYQYAPWTVVPKARLVKIWNDFAKTGLVRDTKGLEQIAQTMIRNTARLELNTELAGHTQTEPRDVLVNHGFEGEIDEKDFERFVDWAVDLPQGGWRISDGMGVLIQLCVELVEQTDPVKKLVLIDRMLNFVHMRNDMAANYVEGGRVTLSGLSASPSELGEEQILEAPRSFDYLINPTANQFIGALNRSKYKTLRGFVSISGDTYWFDAASIDHSIAIDRMVEQGVDLPYDSNIQARAHVFLTAAYTEQALVDADVTSPGAAAKIGRVLIYAYFRHPVRVRDYTRFSQPLALLLHGLERTSAMSVMETETARPFWSVIGDNLEDNGDSLVEAHEYPAPGVLPVPEGRVRRYHRTDPKNVESIRNHGILRSHSQGAAVGDPVAVWSYPADQVEEARRALQAGRAVVEYHVDPKEHASNPYASYSDVTPAQILAIHEPWHQHVRYARENGLSADALRGIDPDHDRAADALKKLQPVSESREEMRVPSGTTTVLVDPSLQEFLGFLNRAPETYLRGAVMKDDQRADRLVFWAGYDCSHSEMAEVLLREWGWGMMEQLQVEKDLIIPDSMDSRWTRFGDVFVEFSKRGTFMETPLGQALQKYRPIPESVDLNEAVLDESNQVRFETGFWYLPETGQFLPVNGNEEHGEVAAREGLGGEINALEQGWVRIGLIPPESYWQANSRSRVRSAMNALYQQFPDQMGQMELRSFSLETPDMDYSGLNQIEFEQALRGHKPVRESEAVYTPPEVLYARRTTETAKRGLRPGCILSVQPDDLGVKLIDLNPAWLRDHEGGPNWLHSLRDTGTCRYIGVVPPRHLRTVGQNPGVRPSATVSETVQQIAIAGYAGRGQKEISVHYNPSPDELLGMSRTAIDGELRGLVVDPNRIVVWNAGLAEHLQVGNSLGISVSGDGQDDELSFTIQPNGDVLQIIGPVHNHPAIVRLLRNPAIRMWTADLNEIVLAEARETLGHFHPLDVHVDPTVNEFLGALNRTEKKRLRGLWMQEESGSDRYHLVVWDAYQGVHSEIAQIVGDEWNWHSAGEFEFELPNPESDRHWRRVGPISYISRYGVDFLMTPLGQQLRARFPV